MQEEKNTVSKINTPQKNNNDDKNLPPKEEIIAEPTLEEDYIELKNMNLLRNVIIRMQYGRYPNKKIESLLSRRMNFDESLYQGPKIIRIIISIMMLFFLCSFAYIIIWLICSSVNFNGIKETASLIISLFFLGSCGFVIFNNLSVPDEKKLKQAIQERMTELEIELKIKSEQKH